MKNLLCVAILSSLGMVASGCGRLSNQSATTSHSHSATASGANRSITSNSTTELNRALITKGTWPAPSPAAVAHLSQAAVDAQQWATIAQLNELSPLASGPGVMICEPVSQSKDAELGFFGAGCGRWLFVTVGGQGELGKSPRWGAPDDVRVDMKWPDLRLSPEKAMILAGKIGVTHVATGSLTQQGERSSLSYQLWEVASGKPVGAPFSVSGTHEAIIAGLPQMARRITVQLGAKRPHLPARVQVTPKQMALLGKTAWKPYHNSPSTPVAELLRLSSHNALAGLLLVRHFDNLNDNMMSRRQRRQKYQALDQMIALSPQNTIVLADVARCYPSSTLQHSGVFNKMHKRYPNNFCLLMADAIRCEQMLKWDEQVQTLTKSVRCAPRSPSAWSALRDALMSQSHRVREGRTMGEMSQEELDYLQSIYPQALASIVYALTLDPHSFRVWKKVSQTAGFAGDSELADLAFCQAWERNPQDWEINSWGLQLFQPKWNGDPAKLKTLIQVIQSDPVMANYQKHGLQEAQSTL
jgi:tetratricopeptide (TPR) repeat protein